MRPTGQELTEIALPKVYEQYGHFTVGTVHSNWLVSDGYYRENGSEPAGQWGGEWISMQKVDWNRKRIEWIPLCRHESSWMGQDDHPHPIFNDDDTYIYFTSNLGGERHIRRIAVPMDQTGEWENKE